MCAAMGETPTSTKAGTKSTASSTYTPSVGMPMPSKMHSAPEMSNSKNTLP